MVKEHDNHVISEQHDRTSSFLPEWAGFQPSPVHNEPLFFMRFHADQGRHPSPTLQPNTHTQIRTPKSWLINPITQFIAHSISIQSSRSDLETKGISKPKTCLRPLRRAWVMGCFKKPLPRNPGWYVHGPGDYSRWFPNFGYIFQVYSS